MKLITTFFGFLCITCYVFGQNPDSVKVKVNQLKKDSSLTNVKNLYKRSIPTSSVQVSDFNSLEKFFNSMHLKDLEARLASDKIKLPIHKRLAGVRNNQRIARKKLKVDYDLSLDSILNSTLLPSSEQERKLKDLRLGLTRSAIGLRTNGNKEYRYIYYRADTKLIRFLPARNSRFSQIYYGELKDASYLSFLRNQFLTFNEDFGALSSEIVAGYFGPFRVNLSTAISKAKEIKIEAAELEGKSNEEIETLVNANNEKNLANNTLATVLAGGGLLALKAQYPLIYFNPTWSPYFKFDNQLVGTLSGHFNIAGSSTPENQMNLWGSYGVENYAYIPLREFTDKDEDISSFGFLFQYNFRHISGSGKFESNLSIEKGFWMSEFKTGIFYNSIQITYTNYNFTNKQIDRQFQNVFTIAYAPK